MNESLRAAAEYAGSVAAATVLAMAILRFFALKWMSEREEFEKKVATDRETDAEKLQTELKAVHTRIDESKDYADRGDKAVREESREAREVLRNHVDREDTILRDRTHTLDTRTQIIANNVALLREEIINLTTASKANTLAVHELTVSIARIIPPKA